MVWLQSDMQDVLSASAANMPRPVRVGPVKSTEDGCVSFEWGYQGVKSLYYCMWYTWLMIRHENDTVDRARERSDPHITEHQRHELERSGVGLAEGGSGFGRCDTARE